jgi:PRC-barrel domain
MSESATSTAHVSKPYIESDRVEGTAVYSTDNKQLGVIKRLVIEKVSGQVVYVVISSGIDRVGHTIPWSKLQYDQRLGGYHTDISASELQAAPAFARQEDHDWSDRDREEELHDYYRIPPYWRSI